MTVKLELRGISTETDANHAMIHCFDENRMIAIGMMDTYFGNLELAKRIANLHNQQPGCEDHLVIMTLQNLSGEK